VDDPTRSIIVETELPERHRLAAAIQDNLDITSKHAYAIENDATSAVFAVLVSLHDDHRRASSEIAALLRHRRAGRAVRALLHDPSRDWTLDELAAQAHTSRATLVRIFRKLTQLTPLTLLTELRLELAKRKLSATDLTVAQIADEIGYQSESALSRAFRRRFGLPPRQAAKQLRASRG
jgi:AraC family transcriptional regulator, activator of mtrCDE